VLGRRLVFAADEYYLLAGRPFPPAEAYEGFPMHEDGIGMARTFELEFTGRADDAHRPAAGFFAWVDGAPPRATGPPATPPATPRPGRWRGDWRGPCGAGPAQVTGPRVGGGWRRAATAPVGILTGPTAPRCGPLVAGLGRDDVRVVIPVANEFFGGNTGVTGLMVGEDLARVLAGEPEGHRYLLPDVCLSEGRFLDGTDPRRPAPAGRGRPTDGIALRPALESR
jgi:hypothetical protein